MLTTTALSGALLIGVELTLTHWFYLYIPWFLPFALVAVVPDWPPPLRRAPPSPSPPRRPRTTRTRAGGRMTRPLDAAGAASALAAIVWAIPLQLGIYADAVITDIPVYQRAYDAIAGGNVPYADFTLEYPPLAAGLFWLAGVLPGPYGVTFSILMLLCLCATVVGVVFLARAIGLDGRRQTVAAVLVAVSPLLIGNLVETRFDMALAAVLTVDALGGRHRALAPRVGPARRGHPAQAGAARADPRADAVAGAPRPARRADGALACGGGGGDRDRAVRDHVAVRHVGAGALPPRPPPPGGVARVGVPPRPPRDRRRPVHDRELFTGARACRAPASAVIAAIMTAVLIVLVIAIAWTFWLGLHRSRHPGDARLFIAGRRGDDGGDAGVRQGPVAPVHRVAAAGGLPGRRALRPAAAAAAAAACC